MAFENEISTELASVRKNSRGEFVVVNKITNKNTGNESVDCRLYYTDDNDEIAPTRKGIRFSTEILSDVILGLVKALEINEVEDLYDELKKMVDEEDEAESADEEEDSADEEDEEIDE